MHQLSFLHEQRLVRDSVHSFWLKNVKKKLIPAMQVLCRDIRTTFLFLILFNSQKIGLVEFKNHLINFGLPSRPLRSRDLLILHIKGSNFPRTKSICIFDLLLTGYIKKFRDTKCTRDIMTNPYFLPIVIHCDFLLTPSTPKLK